MRQEPGGRGQLGQERVSGGEQVLEQVLEVPEAGHDLRRDAHTLSQAPQCVTAVWGVEQQGQVLDRVVVQRVHGLMGALIRKWKSEKLKTRAKT